MKRLGHLWHWLLVAMLWTGFSACAKPREEVIGVSITGIDQLPDHLSVQEFYVDGYNAFRAGGGGSRVCCAAIPKHWRPGLKVEVRWYVTNWRDKTFYGRKEFIPVERYEEPGTLWVHFLKDGSVRVISSGVGPPIFGPNNYPGPHDEIPKKDPWHKYPHEQNDPDFVEISAPSPGKGP